MIQNYERWISACFPKFGGSNIAAPMEIDGKSGSAVPKVAALMQKSGSEVPKVAAPVQNNDKSGSGSGSDSEGGVYALPFDRRRKRELEAAWPFVETAMEKYGIKCELNVDDCYMIFNTRKVADPDTTYMARCLLRLLAVEVPPWRALRVTDGVPCALIFMGCREGHLCHKYGIKQDVYARRKKMLLSLPVQLLEELSGCEVYVRPEHDLVCALGPRPWLMIIRMVVEECILREIPPAPTVKTMSERYTGVKLRF